MNRIKLFAVALALGLTGVVYAAGGAAATQDGKSCHMNEAGASCCASGASCCDGGSCCKADRHKHSAGSNKEGESCCAGGAACCKSGAACCAAHKAADKKGREQAAVAQKDGADCCAAHMQ